MEKTITTYLTRLRQTDQGTEGFLTVPALGFACFTLELPWRENRPCVSSIPPGTYSMAWRVTRRRSTYHIRNVPKRSYILIHSGNYAGDIHKGFKTHVEGCVLLGKRMGWLNGQRAVLVSRSTVRQFNKLMAGQNARIIITEAGEAST
ncbi:hypothetical protein DSLASN_02320 [Desulfoluna limicola]|uniref:DUF5675 domain-containing protein n=1 Tax=Desulfoluna limicola TaxID=2810562 RepID=A0ABM7PBX0_9BACT|nr:DUF5675 family protein [Desulfoluna limicola]BCS94600.1 hypothetical protein DSLASN_02320 [Desulfoluna limicola]